MRCRRAAAGEPDAAVGTREIRDDVGRDRLAGRGIA